MIDKRLMNPEFNPIDDHALGNGGIFNQSARVITLFDRAMLAALPIASDVVGRANTHRSAEVADLAADYAVAYLEARARRLGIEVTP